MTGLSGSGKTTIAQNVAKWCQVHLLDGDDCRKTICKGLGFTPEDREENLMRIAHVALLLNEHTDIIVSCITPYKEIRNKLRELCGNQFRLIYVKASVETCMGRDPKGFYKKALNGEIPNFTGVDDLFDKPKNIDLELDTERFSIEETTTALREYIRQPNKRYHLFVGRWSPFHNAHADMIKQKLDDGQFVAVAVRDTSVDSNNPYPLALRMEMIRNTFPIATENKQLVVFPLIDITSINVGRLPGYDIVNCTVDERAQQISGTEIRRRIKEGGDWKRFVPKPVAELLEENEKEKQC